MSKRTAQNNIGKTFGKLLVNSVEWVAVGKTSVAWATCLCVCGNSTRVRVCNLINGSTRSCGCLRDELSEQRIINFNYVSSNNGTFKGPRIASAYRVFTEHHYNDADISFEEFLLLSQQECFYCGAPPANISNTHKRSKTSSLNTIINGDFIYNGLDRVDNNQAHSKENVVPCCWDCNKAKLKRSKEEFLTWVKNIYTKHFI